METKRQNDIETLRLQLSLLRMELHELRALSGAAAQATDRRISSAIQLCDPAAAQSEEDREALEGCPGADLQPVHVEPQLDCASALPVSDSKVTSGRDTLTRSLDNDGDGVFSLYGFADGPEGPGMSVQLYEQEPESAAQEHPPRRIGLRFAPEGGAPEDASLLMRSGGADPALLYKGFDLARDVVTLPPHGHDGTVTVLTGVSLGAGALEFTAAALEFKDGVLVKVTSADAATVPVAACEGQ